MLYRLLFIAILLTSTKGYAQLVGNISDTATDIDTIKVYAQPVGNISDTVTNIDYGEVGAPLAPLILITFDSITHSEQVRRKKKLIMTDAKEGKLLTNRDFDNVNGNLIVMIFNPTCDHCAHETDMLEQNIGLFKKSRIVMVSPPVTRGYIPDFIVDHKIADYPQISIGVDSAGRFILKTFLFDKSPQINIYDQNKKLLKIFTGNVPIDSLKRYIE